MRKKKRKYSKFKKKLKIDFYEKELPKFKKLFDEMFLLIALKEMKKKLLEKYGKKESLVRYSLLKMVILHVKRVVYMKHLEPLFV